MLHHFHMLHFVINFCLGLQIQVDSLCFGMQYTMYPSTAKGISLAVNDRTMDVRVTSDRPSTP